MTKLTHLLDELFKSPEYISGSLNECIDLENEIILSNGISIQKHLDTTKFDNRKLND